VRRGGWFCHSGPVRPRLAVGAAARGRDRLDRHRDRPRLAYLPHLTSRQSLRLLTKIRSAHTNRGTVQQRKRKAYPMRFDMDVTGRVTRQQASVAE
jgi:hypothetical protein